MIYFDNAATTMPNKEVLDGQTVIKNTRIQPEIIFYYFINKSKEIEDSQKVMKMIKENYLVVSKPNSEDMLKSYKFGYEVDNPSYKFFKNKILESEIEGEVEETFYTLNLQQAKDFFKKSIQELYKSNKNSFRGWKNIINKGGRRNV